MTDASEIESATETKKPKATKSDKQTRHVLEVLRAEGGPLRSITIAKRCNNGVEILSPMRRTTMEILEEIHGLISTGKVRMMYHRLGGNEYEATRGT